jgi:hypothetical protein
MRSWPVADWNGHIAVVVGSGPSAITEPLHLFRYRAKFIVVNDSWKLAPWADVLFACDEAWWDQNNGCPEFAGRRFTASPRTMTKYNIDLFASTGTNSGLRAIFLAERLGANPICLVGFEHHCKNGAHWHRPYEKLRNPGTNQMKTWLQETESAAARFQEKGIRVVNCTRGSALTKYPYAPLEQVITNVTTNPHSAARERCRLPA